jgi:hypothetical protein
MLYLPAEMFKNKKQTFGIFIGKPIPWLTFDKNKKPDEWANWVRNIVYSLS